MTTEITTPTAPQDDTIVPATLADLFAAGHQLEDQLNAMKAEFKDDNAELIETLNRLNTLERDRRAPIEDRLDAIKSRIRLAAIEGQASIQTPAGSVIYVKPQQKAVVVDLVRFIRLLAANPIILLTLVDRADFVLDVNIARALLKKDPRSMDLIEIVDIEQTPRVSFKPAQD